MYNCAKKIHITPSGAQDCLQGAGSPKLDLTVHPLLRLRQFKEAQRMLARNDGITFVCRKCACPKPDAALVCVAAVDCYVPRVACVCRPEEVVIESLCAFSKAAVEQMACKSMRNAIEFFSYNTKQPGMPSWLKEMGDLTTTTFIQLAEASTWYTHNTELINAIGNPLGTVLHNRSLQYAGKTGEPTHGTAVRIKCADGDVLLTQACLL